MAHHIRKNASTRFILFSALIVLVALFSVSAQTPDTKVSARPYVWTAEPDGCTSIQVGRLASEDGSVMTAHTCDGNYRNWISIVPHGKFPAGSKNKIFSGKMHTESPADVRGMVQTGEMPQVAETFQFVNSAYPFMNEAGLAIGETTFGGRRELYNQEGMFMIEEIERIILERCKTAREAIKLAGELIKQYGYGDSGECITIADAKEVWHCEFMGEGPLQKGGVWAAVRIPDDHVGISANIPRISEINLKDPDHYMASENVFKVAQDMGWWDPKSGEPFKWWKVYGGTRKPYSIREFYVFSTLAPSLKLTQDLPELPFSIKPDKKVSIREMFRLYREAYVGTEFDAGKNLMVPRRQMGRPGPPPAAGVPPAAPAPAPEMIRSPLANPWMSGDLAQLANALKPGTVQPTRTIAINGCAYATVLQCRGWLPPAIGTVCWFAPDNPGLSARFPLFAGVTELPAAYEIDGQHRYRTDSATWTMRTANRLALVRWGQTQKMMEDTIRQFEEKGLAELPIVEKRYMEIFNSKTPDKEPFKPAEYLTQYSGDFARAILSKYQELTGKFWYMLRGGI
ncbi:MAG: C69 family dipeptidase [Candidatus Aminicenantes bacterium]|nr:C69 family dipeptidase [Candidatus Aminicenantes bacterium]